jgi:hypothetical protein
LGFFIDLEEDNGVEQLLLYGQIAGMTIALLGSWVDLRGHAHLLLRWVFIESFNRKVEFQQTKTIDDGNVKNHLSAAPPERGSAKEPP